MRPKSVPALGPAMSVCSVPVEDWLKELLNSVSVLPAPRLMVPPLFEREKETGSSVRFAPPERVIVPVLTDGLKPLKADEAPSNVTLAALVLIVPKLAIVELA